MNGTRLSACIAACLLASQPAGAAEPEAAPAFEWAVSAGGTLHDKTRGIALDADGNVLLTGEFTGTATFGEHSVTSAGAMDFFVAKVDPRGKFLWVCTGGGEKIDRGYAVATDPAGNCTPLACSATPRTPAPGATRPPQLPPAAGAANVTHTPFGTGRRATAAPGGSTWRRPRRQPGRP